MNPMDPMDQVFEDVMEGLMHGGRGSECVDVDLQRRDDGSIRADYGDPDVYFVVSIRQIRRDAPDPPVHLPAPEGLSGRCHGFPVWNWP